MMSVEDAAPYDSLFRCIHHVRWYISACGISDPPPRRRPQKRTFATPGLPNRANTHARCNEGLLMMSVEDAAPYDSLFRCIHHVRWSISACGISDPPPRRRPQNSTFATPGLPNRANTHARCHEGLLMMCVEDAAPFDSLFRCNHHVRWSISTCETSDPLPRRRPTHWNFDLRTAPSRPQDCQTGPTPTLDVTRDFL